MQACFQADLAMRQMASTPAIAALLLAGEAPVAICAALRAYMSGAILGARMPRRRLPPMLSPRPDVDVKAPPTSPTPMPRYYGSSAAPALLLRRADERPRFERRCLRPP